MSILKIAHEVRDSIAENATNEAIQILNQALVGHSSLNSLLIRSAQHYGLKKEIIQGTISWDQASINQNKINHAVLQIIEDLVEEEVKTTKVFISYNRDKISSSVAYEIRTRLKGAGFKLFMDVEDTPVGADWGQTILYEIKSCDYFVLLLSEKGNTSEMVIKEVEEAYRLKKVILPIRINFPLEIKFNPRLHTMLYRVQQISWKDEQDTSTIINKMMDVLYGRVNLFADQRLEEKKVVEFITKQESPPSPVAPLEIPRGAVRLDSKYYVKRKGELSFICQIESPGALLRIRGPRQIGKTSLLTRVIAHASELKYNIITIDFQEFDEEIMSSLDSLLWEFCSYFAEEWGLEEELEQYWSKKRARKQLCTSFMEKEVLRRIDQPLLLAIDEIDRLFKFKEVSKEFFLLLRSWHEKSKLINKKEWEKFRLTISYSTEAKLAIQDLNASPFNVGDEAKLLPFTREQIMELSNRYDLHWKGPQIEAIIDLLKGHPYLTRRAMYMVAKNEFSFEELLERAEKQDGPFSDHLRHHLINLKQVPKVMSIMKDIVERARCNDSLIASRLRATGLVIGSPPEMTPANGLYAKYFKGKL